MVQTGHTRMNSLQHIQVLFTLWKRQGLTMAGMDFFIRPATGTSSSDWVRIANAGITGILVRMLTDKDTNKPKGMAFVQLPSEEDVVKTKNIHIYIYIYIIYIYIYTLMYLKRIYS